MIGAIFYCVFCPRCWRKKLPGWIHLPGSEAPAFRALKTTAQSPGDQLLEQGGGKEGGPLALAQWFATSVPVLALLRSSSPSLQTWLEPELTQSWRYRAEISTCPPPLLPSSFPSCFLPPLLRIQHTLINCFNVGPLEISFAVLRGLRGLPRWAPKLIPVSS